jgi:hypothetical protein
MGTLINFRAMDDLERRYDGPIPAPFPPVDLERERQGDLEAAANFDHEAEECERRAAVHTARSKVEGNCKWRLRQAAAWHDEARKHRQTAAMLRESAAGRTARLNEIMAEASASRAAAQ